MTDIISRLAALTAADDLRGEIITATLAAEFCRDIKRAGRVRFACSY
jgi:hypothetical protein